MSHDSMQALARRAVDFGFSHAAVLDVQTLALRPEVRDMCAADKCHAYGKNWTCPPACGSLEDNAKRFLDFSEGILVQTTAQLEDDFDIEAMQAAGQRQSKLFLAFRKELAKEYAQLLPLGSGACSRCGSCSYPDAPCRFPDEAAPSMEAFGLWVSDVCLKNDLQYYYGPQTITYTGCYLLK